MKLKDINIEIKADFKKGIKAVNAQRFTSIIGGRTFIVVRKTKTEIDYQDIETKETFYSTPNDSTSFFLVEDQ